MIYGTYHTLGFVADTLIPVVYPAARGQRTKSALEQKLAVYRPKALKFATQMEVAVLTGLILTGLGYAFHCQRFTKGRPIHDSA